MRPLLLTRFSLFCTLFTVAVSSALADTVTWSANPQDSNWYNPANWNPAQVPNSPDTTAFLGLSSNTTMELPEDSTTDLDGIDIEEAGSSQRYLVSLLPGATLAFHGAGVIKNSITFQTDMFDTSEGSRFEFYGSAQAGRYIIYNAFQGEIHFYDQSSADAGYTVYAENQGSVGSKGKVVLHDQSSLGGASLSVQAGSAGNAGGEVDLNDDSTADDAVFILSGNAVLDISGHNAPGVTISATEGNNGAIYLGARELTFNPPGLLNCLASLRDGGQAGGHGGSLTKTGPNNLVLHRRSTYSGGTKVLEGTLTIYSQSGSATGRGPVTVTGGTLGGFGIIAGDVTIGDSAGSGGNLTLIRVGGQLGTLTAQASLTFASDGVGQFEIDDDRVQSATVSALGVSIDPQAKIQLLDRKPAPLPAGTSFTLIENTSSSPINGTFGNLPEGGTIVVGPNTYRATYQGGTGNDLVVTVQ